MRALLRWSSSKVRGVLVEPRDAPALPPQRVGGTFELDALEMDQSAAMERDRYFADCRRGAIAYLEGQIEKLDAESSSRARLEEELESLRGMGAPLGSVLATLDTGNLEVGDVVPVRILQMDRANQFIKCSRIYPRKLVVRMQEESSILSTKPSSPLPSSQSGDASELAAQGSPTPTSEVAS